MYFFFLLLSLPIRPLSPSPWSSHQSQLVSDGAYNTSFSPYCTFRALTFSVYYSSRGEQPLAAAEILSMQVFKWCSDSMLHSYLQVQGGSRTTNRLYRLLQWLHYVCPFPISPAFPINGQHGATSSGTQTLEQHRRTTCSSHTNQLVVIFVRFDCFDSTELFLKNRCLFTMSGDSVFILQKGNRMTQQ